MLDEAVVKRGVSDRKMRSLPEQQGLSMPLYSGEFVRDAADLAHPKHGQDAVDRIPPRACKLAGPG